MPDDVVAGLELTEIAVSSEPLPRRAEALLGALGRVVPFDSAWLALADPYHPCYTSLARADLADSTLAFLAGPSHARDIEVAGTHRATLPVSPSDLPYPAEDLPSWAECLLPAGYHEGLGVALFAPGGRHVGFLALLSGASEPPSHDARRLLARFASILALGIDPMRSLAAAARLVQGATAGVVILREDGGIQALPGLRSHAVLVADSPALAAARAAIDAGRLYTSFLWPLGDRPAPLGYVRITALGSSGDTPAHLSGVALVSPPGDLRGLTPRELEVLGLVIDGCPNRQIARVLLVAQRTVAAHLEHILVKLSAPSRTLAAVRAHREGLYVPSPRRILPQHP
jgi:DNA-binding CsgD family transcriptional regulator